MANLYRNVVNFMMIEEDAACFVWNLLKIVLFCLENSIESFGRQRKGSLKPSKRKLILSSLLYHYISNIVLLLLLPKPNINLKKTYDLD